MFHSGTRIQILHQLVKYRTLVIRLVTGVFKHTAYRFTEVFNIDFILSGKFFKDISASAIETKAKVLALKRWLQEFTRLDEAVPTDVILWNRLLVMAVALGVADKVIEQLKVVMPELLDDPSFMPVYSWYYMGHSGMGSPADVFGGAIHDASVAAIANSVDASGGGGGGGFSSGGGGGFGGGGGGGAF